MNYILTHNQETSIDETFHTITLIIKASATLSEVNECREVLYSLVKDIFGYYDSRAHKVSTTKTGTKIVYTGYQMK